MGNHSLVSMYITKVMATLTKEHRNRYNIPLPNWITRYLPHCFITPQHALKKPEKAMRLVFDASKRYTADSVPINRMMSTHLGTEMQCEYGDTFHASLECVHDLRITHPTKDIVTHANDVKSCFEQLKLQPNVMATLSIQVADFIFLQSAFPFGTDFSTENWEPVR